MRYLRTSLIAACWLVLAPAAIRGGEAPPRMPMQVDFSHSAEFRWLNKPVLEARTLDDMSDPGRWSLEGPGTLKLSRAGARAGRRSLQVEVGIHDQQPAPSGRSATGVRLVRAIPGEDWRGFNRISFWIRPELSGFPMFPLLVVLRNEGAEKVPDIYHREGNHYVTLPNRQWTHVVWEIASLARDRVTAVELYYWVNKRLPDPGDRVAFEVAELELQQVEPDRFEGWEVAPDALAFSHTGYPAGSSKTAIASGLSAAEFSLVNVMTGESVLTQAVRTLRTRLGSFQVLDFSAAQSPGEYILRAGDVTTRGFRIDPDVWLPTIWKSLNFFYGERCGMRIPGIHDACHRDWQAVVDQKSVIMNGGWHDAGDLSEGAINTAEATYAMFALAERLRADGEDPALVRRLIEEADWGLDWLLKVRFPGGYRIGFAGMNIWTDGILGNEDDRSRPALNNPNVNYLAATAEAIAARIWREADPERAALALRIAEDDWEQAVQGKETAENLSTPAFAASEMEMASVGILSSLELYRSTGRQRYADKAQELAEGVIDSQQRSYVGGKFPLAGFFYTGPDRKEIFHQFHRGNDQAPMVAMARLCEAFPDHPDWMRWYSVVALYSEYQKSSAATTEPYGVLPAYVYRADDVASIAEGDRYQSSRQAYREQVAQGLPMGEGYFLKAFPVWYARRGNFGVLLSQAKGLSTAGQLRGDWAATDLAQRQLEWIVGRNPFSQSTMWGEGYDFTQQYSVSSGDLVGSLPVGIKTRGNSDVPYWPPQNCYVYKEVWVHPSARWLWLMQDLAGPARVDGRVAPGFRGPVTFEHGLSGAIFTVEPDPIQGTFHRSLPEGPYRVRWEGRETAVTLLPGGGRFLDLRPGRWVDFQLDSETNPEGGVELRLTARGSGTHRFALRAFNLEAGLADRELKLEPGVPAQLTWTTRIETASTPWIVVVIPDEDASQRRELYATALPTR